MQDVYRLVNLLPAQPAMGRAGRVAGTRELVVQDYPFIIPYRVQQDETHILRVFHTRLRLPSQW
ncbi:MAG: type II toxin-antitoxin system RelE/ParE family toxin [Shewanella sp.]